MKRNLQFFSLSITNTNYDFIYMIPIVGGVFIYIFLWSTESCIIFINSTWILGEIFFICVWI